MVQWREINENEKNLFSLTRYRAIQLNGLETREGKLLLIVSLTERC